MKDKKIVIIGMGPAAIGAASAISFTNPGIETILIEKKAYESYSPCGMPFAFEDKLKFEDLKHEFPVKGRKNKIYLNIEAKKIDTEKKEVLIETKDKQEVLKYDSLIITTGTKPFTPTINGIGLSGVYAIDGLETVSKLHFITKCLRKAMIIGAGAIGLEFALAMKKKGLDVLVAEMMPQVLPNAVDADMARHVQEYLEEKGVGILTGSKLESVDGYYNQVGSVIVNGKEHKTNLVVLSCGTMPNIDIVKDTDIKYNKNGIVTDKRMMTNVKDVYAAGDCIETFNLLTKKRCRSGLAVPARKQGRIAGLNAAGKKATYQGTLNTFISVLDEYAVGSTGLTAEQAKQDYETIMQKIRGKNKPEYYPGHKDLIVKLIASKDGKLLGGQAFGEKYAVKNRIDVIASYLSRKSSLKDMMNGELAYCPDIAPIPDPLTIALDFMLRRTR